MVYKLRLLGLAAPDGVVHAAGKTFHVATAGSASVTIESDNIVVHAGKKSFTCPNYQAELKGLVRGDLKKQRITGF